ncbi:MAG: T9SS type A sorting domain-containing protein, partial [Bacteroidia bacterium]|nr:T9SS type A sorting domain-containing protein [Bacteroidia bacterium]
GSEPTCQLTDGTTATTYATTAANSTGFNWSLSNGLAGSIGLTTGVMIWTEGFSGSVDIQVTASGCNSTSSQVIRTVNITPAVGTPTAITVSGGNEPTCELTAGTTMTFYSTTATNSTGFSWSLSDAAAGSINATTGLMTWINGYSGTVNIQVVAIGCGTSSQVIRPVTVNPLPLVTITGPSAPRITSAGNIYETEAWMSGYSWSMSAGGIGIVTDNTYSVNWNTTGNQTVSVNYIDLNGCTAVSPTTYNVVVKPIPAVSGASISGYPSVGNNLTTTYTYTDGSSGTNASTYRWLRNGTDPIIGATGTTYVPVTADINKTLTFEITPVSTVGPPYAGSVITSPATELVEDLTGVPVADEVCIEGIRAEGNIIRGEYRYTFSKAEGISTYKWYRKDIDTSTSVVIGTNIQYTLVAADIDDTQEIIFEVTPVSSNLTPIVGAAVQSNPLARILIPKTDYSVSEADVRLSANVLGGVFSGSGVTGSIFSPSSAGSSGSPYTITYLLNIVNTSSSCSQQASKIITVYPNVSSFDGFDPLYCHDSGQDTITVTGVPTGATDRIFTLTNSNGIIYTSGDTIAIDPGRMHPGIDKDSIYFSYKYLGIFYQISQPFKIDSVGTEINILNLNLAYCQKDPKEYISVEGVYPIGGTATWTGDILSDTKPASAYADPSLGTAGVSYPVFYQYKSPNGCYSAVLRDTVIINPLPDPLFPLNSTYNIDGGPVALIPVQTGGTFSGNGISGDKMFPDIAGLGEHEIKYSITDDNGCSASLGLKTRIRIAQGNFIDIPSVICYKDTTYNVKVINLPVPMSGVQITGFTNTKNTLVYTFGATNADYNVPVAGEGLDTLIFSYKWDGVDYSISKAIIVDSLGQVVIKNLAFGEQICDNVTPYDLIPSIYGGSFTGPMSGSYLDPTKASGATSVSYTYTNINTGCSTSTTVPITIYPAPEVAFLPVDVCIESDLDTTHFINNTKSAETVDSWFWQFTDAGVPYPDSTKNPGYLYKTSGLQKISLKATTVNGCSATLDTTINLGRRPGADFYWRSDCLHPNDSIILQDATISTSPIDSLIWKIYKGNKFSAFSTQVKEAKYLKSDTGYLKFQYIVKTTYKNCIDTVTKDIFIKPAITIRSDGYFENFEAGNGGWVKGEVSGNNWSFGLPDRNTINTAYSGVNAWFTGFDIDSSKMESSSIVSPCYDFSATERPLIKLRLWRMFTRDIDGAVLQYRIGDSGEWKSVGAIDDGIQWYNSAVIRGEPGGSQMGWTLRGNPDDEWVEAIHTLDGLKGKSDVIFRIAYGSDGSKLDKEGEGIAFDDIWIGERSRNILLEHFTNTNNDVTTNDANDLVNIIARNRSEDVINIQYHTNFPGTDPYYDANQGDASARILFYGLTRTPYTFIDGGTKKDFAYMYAYDSDITQIDSNNVTKRSLIRSLFNISLTTSVFDGVLTVNGKLKALEDIDSENLTLFIAVTEKRDSLDNKEFRNIFRKFIPDAGGILLRSNWTRKDSLTIEEQTWTLDKILNRSDFEVIAFIQNTITKEIFQASSVIQPAIVVGIEDPPGASGNGFILYPNPAVKQLTISFEVPLTQETDIRIYDMRGVVISSYKAGSGVSEFTIDDLNLKGGLYLVRITSGGIDLGFRKLVVSGD